MERITFRQKNFGIHCTGQIATRDELTLLIDCLKRYPIGYPKISRPRKDLKKVCTNLATGWEIFKIEDLDGTIETIAAKSKAVDYFLRLSLRQLCIDRHRYEIGDEVTVPGTSTGQRYFLRKITESLMYGVSKKDETTITYYDPINTELDLKKGKFRI
jgi:hypothetical protein